MNIKTTMAVIALCAAGFARSKDTTDAAYLCAYMTGSDEKHLYFAVSEDGYLFDAINGGRPILGASFDDRLVRDPHIFKDKDGVYRMVATVSWKNRPFTIWDSKDLVHWENERLVDVAPPDASKTWAPELALDEESGLYFVYWTAEQNNDWDTAAIWYATTRDFRKWSEPKVLYRAQGGILDANIVKIDGIWNLVFRGTVDGKKGIHLAVSRSALGPYEYSHRITAHNMEGPFLFENRTDKGTYALMMDDYGRSAGFELFETRDLKDWRRLTNEKPPYYNDKVRFPKGIRHGAVIPISEAELAALKKAFPGD